MVNILDVAKLAKVSPSTVSHALSGKRSISPATKERIFSAIESLGYVPSRNASSLRTGTSGSIGFYTADITEGHASWIIKGIERGLAGSDLSMLLVSGIEFNNDFSRAYRFLRSHNIDGLMYCHHFYSEADMFESIEIPVVAINMMQKGMKSIMADNINGGIIAAEHLVSSGMKRPAMICGPRNRLAVEKRLFGFSERLQALGLDFPPDHHIFGEYTYEHGFTAAYQLMKLDPAIDGIFCINDSIAAGTINRLTGMGYRIPNDVKVLGYDNRDFSEFWNIPISTIDQHMEQMGFLGITALRRAILSRENDTAHEILKPTLIVRNSTQGGRK